jgi:EKC/KEOPS complex subunit PCC1/LAGE3
MNFVCELNFPLATTRHAEIVYNTVRIDKEPKKTVQRIETLDKNILHVRFEAEEAKFIRVAVESYIEKINLILRTIQRFDPKVKH